MPTTTKMGIVYPSSTDLVKDGATAMGTISNTVDAKTGLVLISTSSFTGVSSQSFNNVFSSNYDNYKVILSNLIQSSDNVFFQLRLRASGTDNTTTNYYWRNTDVAAGSIAYTSNNQDYVMIGYAPRSETTGITLDFLMPNLSGQPTTIYGQSFVRLNSGGQRNSYGIYGYFSTSTSFDGFTIFGGSSYTGQMSIYGYNK